jgi:hypothetical protein
VTGSPRCIRSADEADLEVVDEKARAAFQGFLYRTPGRKFADTSHAVTWEDVPPRNRQVTGDTCVSQGRAVLIVTRVALSRHKDMSARDATL